MRGNFIIVSIILLVCAGHAQASTLRVMISGGLIRAYEKLAPRYEALTGNHLITVQGASMGANPSAIPARLERGEPADAVIMIRSALDKLVSDGLVEKNSVRDIGIGYLAMAVRTGMPQPDIHTVASVRHTLLSAKSVAFTDSAGGKYLQTVVFGRLHIAKEMESKSTVIEGASVAPLIARGRYEIGFQQLSELKSVPGILVVGMIPAPSQKATMFSAAIVTKARNPKAAKSLIRYLCSPAASYEIRSSGLVPARR